MPVQDKETKLSHTRVLELFDYDEKAGRLFRKIGITSQPAGKIAGHLDNAGYRRMRVDGNRYLEHRVIWFYVHARWPAKQLDHINGNPIDNRISNLREATQSQNNANLLNRYGKPPRGTYRSGKRYGARIWVNRVSYYLGIFDTEPEAYAAYLAARELHYGNHAYHLSRPDKKEADSN